MCKKCAKQEPVCQKRVFQIHDDEYEPQGLLDMTVTHKVETTQLDNILSGLETACGSLNALNENVTNQVMKLLGPATESVSIFVAKAALCLASVWRARDDVVLVVMCIAQFLLSLGVTHAVVTAFQDFVTKHVTDLKPQAPNVEEIFYVVAYFMNIVTFSVAPSFASLSHFFRNVSSIRVVKDVTVDVFGVVRDVVLSAIDFVAENFLGHSPKWAKRQSYDVVCDWCDQIDALFELSTKQEWSLDMLDRLDVLTDTHKSIQDLWRTTKPPVKVVAIFQSHANVMRKMLEEVSVRGVRQLPRAEPSFVLMQGPSAMGKSLITPIVATDLLKNCVELGANASWSSYIYNRNAETTFWDGYAGQKVIIYDDFGQYYDSHTVPNPELMEVIRLGNSAPFFPNMARLEAKGRTRINCDFVVLTCNQIPTLESIGSMKQPDAVLRRFDFVVKFSIKRHFLHNTPKGAPVVVNWERVLNVHRDGMCGCNVDKAVDVCLACYEFDILQWFSNDFVPKKTAISYNELLDFICEQHKRKHAMSQKRVEYINKRLAERDNFVDAPAASYAAQGGKLDDLGPRLIDDFITDFQGSHNFYERVRLCAEYKYTIVASAQLLKNYFSHIYLFVRASGVIDDSQFEPEDGEAVYVPQIGEEDEGSIFEQCERLLDSCALAVGRKQPDVWTQAHERRYQEWLATVTPKQLNLFYLLKTFKIDITGFLPKEQYAMLRKIEADLPHTSRVDDSDVDERYSTLYTIVYLLNQERASVNGKIAEKTLLTWLGDDPLYEGVCDMVADGTLGADYLIDLCKQEGKSPPEFHPVSKCRSLFERIRTEVTKRVESYSSNPVFYMISALGAAAVAGLFAKFVYPLFKPKELVSNARDIINVRLVGETFKKDVLKHDALRVDETKECLYIRLDKGKYLCEAVSSSPSEKSDSNRSANWRRNEKQYSHKQHYTSRTLTPDTFADPGISDVEKIMCKSMVALYRENNDVRTFGGHGLLVKGRLMLTFEHLFSTPFEKLVLKRVLSKQEFVFDRSVLKRVSLVVGGKDVDACLVELPRQFPASRDIVDHFSPVEHSMDTHLHARLISVRGLGDTGAIRVSSGDAIASDEPISYNLTADGKKHVHYVRRSYHHWMDTAAGDCGAVLLQVGTHLPHKIIGIHVAGSHKDPDAANIACAISREQITNAIACFSVEAGISPTLDGLGATYDLTAQCNMLPDFTIIAKVEEGAQDAIKSMLLKTPLFEWNGAAVTQPAVLYANVDGKDLKTTMVEAKNAQRPMIHFDKSKLDIALAETKRKMNSFRLKDEDVNTRCLTIQEVVFGREGDKYMPSLSVDSSSGYPWVLKVRRKGKRDFIDLDKRWISQTVVDAVNTRVSRAKDNLRTPTIFTDHLKDERRLIERQKYMKPRLFSAGPIDYTIAFKQYFGAYIAYVMRNRIENSVAVGINVHGAEWTYLAERLLAKGDNILAGDFTAYDSSLNGEMLWNVLDVVNDWYADGNNNVRMVLWAELVDALHLFRNTIYQVGQGNPSGNPMTTILNSVYQYLAWVYVVVRMGFSTQDFVDKCFLVTYGDDNVMSVFEKFLDPAQLVEGFASIGMELTAESKTDTFGYKRIGDVRFLKRAFRYDDLVCRYLAPMPLELVVEITYWMHKGHHWRELQAQVCDTFARELAHHEEKIFVDLLKKLRLFMRGKGLVMPPLLQLGAYRQKMISGEDYDCEFVFCV